MLHQLAQVLNLSGNKALFKGSRLEPRTLTRFKTLQHLDLSDCAISGALPASLASAFSLQHLNLSGNPQLSGTLPEAWAGLIDLQVVDVSGCGVSGTLPESWATLQQLRVFKASDNKPGVSGQLPETWGLLGKLEVLDVNGAHLSGTLPAIWADSAAMAASSGAMLAEAAQQTAEAAVNPSSTDPDALKVQRVARATADVAVKNLQQAVKPRESFVLGMLNLRQLILSNNKLTGELPGKWAALKQLQVGGAGLWVDLVGVF